MSRERCSACDFVGPESVASTAHHPSSHNCPLWQRVVAAEADTAALKARAEKAEARVMELEEMLDAGFRAEHDDLRAKLVQAREALDAMCRAHTEVLSEDGSAWDAANHDAWVKVRAALAALSEDAVAKQVDAPLHQVVPGSLPGVAGSNPAFCTLNHKPPLIRSILDIDGDWIGYESATTTKDGAWVCPSCNGEGCPTGCDTPDQS